MPFAAAPLDKPRAARSTPAAARRRSSCRRCRWPRSRCRPRTSRSLPTQPPRTLPCIGAWTGAASESLECGRARFQQGRVRRRRQGAGERRATGLRARDRHRGALLAGARPTTGSAASSRPTGCSARSLRRPAPGLGTVGAAQQRLDGAAPGRRRARARRLHRAAARGRCPSPLEAWAPLRPRARQLRRSAVTRTPEQAWAHAAAARGCRSLLARDVLFWHGEALGPHRRAARAATELKRFVEGGPHPLLTDRAAAAGVVDAWPPGATPDARRGLPSLSRQRAGRRRARLGRGRAGAGAARHRRLGRRRATPPRRWATRRSPLALPLLLRLLQGARRCVRRRADVGPIVQDLLGSDLTPAMRALGAARQGRGRPRPGQSRRGAHAVRAGAHDGRRDAAGRPRGASAWRARTSSCASSAGAERSRAAGRRAAAPPTCASRC